MPKLHDFRSNFRYGRISGGLRVRQDAKPYRAALRNTVNWMILSDGTAERRWGTNVVKLLSGACRLETWQYGPTVESTWLVLLFESGKIELRDLDGVLLFSDATMPWTSANIDFIQLQPTQFELTITDVLFRPVVIEYDGTTWTKKTFAFSENDQEELNAPFFEFDDTITMTMNGWTKATEDQALAQAIRTAQSSTLTDAELAVGRTEMVSSAAFFTGRQVGDRLRFGGGEVEITEVVSATEANGTVIKNLGVKLPSNPFFFRKGSAKVEVAMPEHGLMPGDSVFFSGLSAADDARLLLTSGLIYSTNAAHVTAGNYTVDRVPDPDHFEITAEVASTLDILLGGSDVTAWVITANEVTEPVFSDLRGWPQCSALYQSRRWLGGSDALPDALFGSQFNAFEDFNTGTGEDDEAVALYGIGSEARILHLLSAFDLVILTSKGEFYIPGNPEKAVTPGTARAVDAKTAKGSAYTKPVSFDGGIFFVDKGGQHIRELSLQNGEYSADAMSIVVPDWIQDPKRVTVFGGSANEATPYSIWWNALDNSLIVLHAERSDDSFGWMRWEANGLGTPKFWDVAAVGNRLFTIMSRVENAVTVYYLNEFDTSRTGKGGDFQVVESNPGSPTDTFTIPELAYAQVQVWGDGRPVVGPGAEITVSAAGAITLPEAVEEAVFAIGNSHFIEMTPPVAASGQGMKGGKMVNLVDAEVNWLESETGVAGGEELITAVDREFLGAITPVDEWRHYVLGEWDREPVFRIEGEDLGNVGVRAITLNVYF